MKTAFQDKNGALHYLEKIREGIPLGSVQMQLVLELLEYFVLDPRTAVDLGCGDGTLAEFLLRVYPDIQVICVDHSAPMLEFARKRLAPFDGRVRFILEDFSSDASAWADAGADLVVSGYAIHHLPNDEKLRLYQRIYAVLNPGGLFLNMEHVASATGELGGLFDKLFVDFLAERREMDQESAKAEYDSRPDKADNRLERVELQVEWLRSIGFHHADCFFKWMELAVFGGVK